MRLHHVQVACPPGGEDGARRFYGEGLGLTEVEKPEDLRARGGAWFRAHDAAGAVAAEIHVGVEDPFVPARKAHPALLLAGVTELEQVATRLGGLGFEVDWSQRHTFPGHERLHTFDEHGNRVELLAAQSY
jgi:catechol 2,3-dioxygenase-like lactoylglutathione lyase family enzyme